MPYRKIPIVAGEIYHVFNRSIAGQPIFISNKDSQRAMEVIEFYRHKDLPSISTQDTNAREHYSSQCLKQLELNQIIS